MEIELSYLYGMLWKSDIPDNFFLKEEIDVMINLKKLKKKDKEKR